jgi:hypothetical protein
MIMDSGGRSISVRPGELFNVAVVALSQSGSPVPTTIFNQNRYEIDQCRLSPSSQFITGACCDLYPFNYIVLPPLIDNSSYFHGVFVRALLKV